MNNLEYMSIMIVLIILMINIEIIQGTKMNYFSPILSSNTYRGYIQENERTVQIEPRLYASDLDPSNTINGQICGYELSLHKHDDRFNENSNHIPFYIDITLEQPIIKLKQQIERIDCEIKQIHRFYIRAYDCANENQRRYSERSLLIITVNDINEYQPVFTHANYLFRLYQNEICSSCQVEATDDDCSNENQRVCDYRILTSNMPFAIDSNGSISIIKPLENDRYEFNIIAIDCFPSQENQYKQVTSEPVPVTIQIIKSCQPTITDNNPTKLTILTDHTHVFDTVHVDTCDDICPIESIHGTIALDSNGLDNGCKMEQCAAINREYVLVPKDDDSIHKPQRKIMTFNGFDNAVIIEKNEFFGQLKNDFTIRMWMKHADEQMNDDKQNILCKTDRKFKIRHHFALLIENNYLKLVLRKDSLNLFNENNLHTSEWKWKIEQINDNQWHSYKLFVNYPNKIDLYIDEQLFLVNNDNFQLIEDYSLVNIEQIDDTVLTLGACWHSRTSSMIEHFHGQLSGVTIEQNDESNSTNACQRDCQEYLDIADLKATNDIEITNNINRSQWTIESESIESFEQLLKHFIYRNTFQPIGPSGQRILTLKIRLKCFNENSTIQLPIFTRRLVIDEMIQSTNIELHANANYSMKPNENMYLFANLSILTDHIKREQVDLTDCSINTLPDFDYNEQLIISNGNLQINNIENILTKTGLVLSGLATIDTYQNLLRQILFISKSPVKYTDRTFSLICIGTHERISTNEIHIRIHIEQTILPSAPVASVLSNKLYVDNDEIHNNLFDIEGQSAGNLSGWPIAVVVCISVSVAGVLVLYLVTRIRSGNRQHNQLNVPGDDIHSQMEWEDDIGLNIIVNPLDETKKTVQSINSNQINEHRNDEYDGTTSDDDDDEYDGHSQNEYSSENDEDDEDEYDNDCYDHNQIHSKKHQLEWDDEVMEYGPKKV